MTQFCPDLAKFPDVRFPEFLEKSYTFFSPQLHSLYLEKVLLCTITPNFVSSLNNQTSHLR